MLVKIAVPFDRGPVPSVALVVESLNVTISPSCGGPAAEVTLLSIVTLVPNATVPDEIELKVVVEAVCTPKPVSGAIFGLPGPLSVMVTAAFRVPVAVGVKVTLILQLPFGGSDEGQLLV